MRLVHDKESCMQAACVEVLSEEGKKGTRMHYGSSGSGRFKLLEEFMPP